MKIAIIEDDIAISQMYRFKFEAEGYEVETAENGILGLELCETMQPDIILLDIMMPEIDGFEFAETVRQVNKQIPILFMSAKDDLPSKRKGFLVGIDDYMVKPVELAELEMRVRALLRRSNIEMERKLIVGNLEMDADGMTATINGEEIPVTTREFNILYKLLSYPKKTFTRAQLMDEFWGLDSGTSLRAVDVYVTKLRDKFSTCDGFEIKTVRGLGYKAVLL
jgi:DNA-binding response OmpR family regulator